ncbi:MAG: sulfite exporter TauE/SafE family protein [Crocinitomicaceae bacterium]|nr:sulfite exporter TauE/SafE family protein [Crocinitomicaceae bacterium]
MNFLWVAITLGLTSTLHCLGMCGPLMGLLPVKHLPVQQQWFAFGFYHFGRLAVYALLGWVLGQLAAYLDLFGFLQILSMISGGVLLAFGLFQIFQKKVSANTNWVRFLKKPMGFVLRLKGQQKWFLLGGLNGMLPCGMLALALAAAFACGTPMEGSFFMLTFGLGTLPGFFGLKILLNRMKGFQKLAKLQLVLPILIGALLLLRGMNLGVPYVSPQMDKNVEHVDKRIEMPLCH